ncbi:MAG TPA: hypothetical protein VLB76_29420 [Thermoanaerobaculia bacterium]|nr:hypothetical protein [Thermoanaerobaculia bacterium]
MSDVATKKAGALNSLAQAFTSWRTASVILMSFASGMPLGLVWFAIPDWMRKSGWTSASSALLSGEIHRAVMSRLPTDLPCTRFFPLVEACTPIG